MINQDKLSMQLTHLLIIKQRETMTCTETDKTPMSLHIYSSYTCWGLTLHYIIDLISCTSKIN